MSGGHYEFVYHKIELLANDIQEKGCEHCVDKKLRRAFRALLYRVAKAARAIEWNDSGDGDDDEYALVMKCFTQIASVLKDKIPKQRERDEDE